MPKGIDPDSVGRALVAWFTVLALVAACGVSSEGLGNSADAKPTSTSSKPIPCPRNLPDKAGWPASFTAGACVMSCGPDNLGERTCSKTDLATCKGNGGCLCQQEPCTTCSGCTIPSQQTCYLPTNRNNPSDCPAFAKNGEACASACGKQICLRADGKTGCVCNDQGKYACAVWGGGSWE